MPLVQVEVNLMQPAASSEPIRVLHLVGGKLFLGGTASVVRDLVKGSDSSVVNWTWVHRDCPAELDMSLVRKGSSQVVSASILGDLSGAIRDLPSLLQTIKELDIAVLHAHTRLGIFAGWLAHLFARTPLIVHLHFLARRPWLYRILIRTAAATVIYNSARSCDHYGGALKTDYVVMPTLNWPTKDLRKSSELRVVAASALVPNKNVDVIIEATNALQNLHAAPSLVIYGLLPEDIAPARQQELLNEYRRLTFLNFVKWTGGWADLLTNSDIFAHAGASESFGLTILEAFARGLKIVVRRPCFLETIDPKLASNGVYYVVDGSVTDFAEAINAALNDPIKSDDLRDLRRSIASEFSPEVAAQKVTAIYQSVVRQ